MQALIFTVLLPAGLIYLTARVSGWRRLAANYPPRGPFPRPRVWLGYGVFRGWIGYNGGILVGSDQGGSYLRATPFVLSFCHPPIHIPWTQVTGISEERGAFSRGYRIRTILASDVRFALRPSTFAAVREDARAAGVPGVH